VGVGAGVTTGAVTGAVAAVVGDAVVVVLGLFIADPMTDRIMRASIPVIILCREKKFL
jgi:hypothetical protein